jgi:hypothetical protein
MGVRVKEAIPSPAVFAKEATGIPPGQPLPFLFGEEGVLLLQNPY